jgi:hypothetical protein
MRKISWEEFIQKKKEMCERNNAEFMLEFWEESKLSEYLLKEKISGLKMILRFTEDAHSNQWSEEEVAVMHKAIARLKAKYEID